MGWAKYLEDNISIYDDRMYLKERIDVFTTAQQVKQHVAVKSTNERKAKKNSKATIPADSRNVRTKRCGLELKFSVAPEKSLVRKLQLNGWWWSNNVGSWCNTDSEENRQYVRTFLRKWEPIMLISEVC